MPSTLSLPRLCSSSSSPPRAIFHPSPGDRPVPFPSVASLSGVGRLSATTGNRAERRSIWRALELSLTIVVAMRVRGDGGGGGEGESLIS